MTAEEQRENRRELLIYIDSHKTRTEKRLTRNLFWQFLTVCIGLDLVLKIDLLFPLISGYLQLGSNPKASHAFALLLPALLVYLFITFGYIQGQFLNSRLIFYALTKRLIDQTLDDTDIAHLPKSAKEAPPKNHLDNIRDYSYTTLRSPNWFDYMPLHEGDSNKFQSRVSLCITIALMFANHFYDDDPDFL